MANCLVLGANGSIGSFIAERLAKEGHAVRAFDRFSGKDNLKGAGPAVLKVKGDYLNDPDVENSVRGCEVIFHCIHTTVPRASLLRPVFDAETNIAPAVKLLQAAANSGAGKIVYISSLAVYGNPGKAAVKETDELAPLSPYGASKLAVERWIGCCSRQAGFDYAVLRPAAAYSERQAVSPDSGVAANFIYNALRNKPLVVYGEGSAVRDLLHAEDVAKGAVLAAFRKTSDKVFNLGTGRGITVRGLAEKVRRVTKSGSKIEFGGAAEEIPMLVCDATRAREQLGWRPGISLEEGIKRCAAAFRAELG